MVKWIFLGIAGGAFLLAVLCIILEKCDVTAGADRKLEEAADERRFTVKPPVWVPMTSWLCGLSLTAVALYFAVSVPIRTPGSRVIQIFMLAGVFLMALTYFVRGVKEAVFRLEVDGDRFRVRQARKPRKLEFTRADIQSSHLAVSGREQLMIIRTSAGPLSLHSRSCICGDRLEKLLRPDTRQE